MTGKGVAVRYPAEVQRRIDAAMLLFDRTSDLLPDPDEQRDARAAHFARHARAQTTRDKYLFFIGLYLDWCAHVGRQELGRDRRGATPATLEAFAIELASRVVRKGKNKGVVGMSPATIRLACAAVRTFHRVQGINPPDLGLVDQMLEGHARLRAEANIKDDVGSPALQLPTLREMFAVCDPATNAGARDRALLSLGWATMARRSELAALQITQVSPADSGGVKVTISRSKTDQLGKGRTVWVPWKPELGELCPVLNIQRWQQVLSDCGITTDGFFRGVDKHGHINGHDAWGGPKYSPFMDPTTVERVIVRTAARAAAANGHNYTAHSLRSGGATDLHLAGVSVVYIARQGGWNERSPVIFRYIRDVPTWENNALALAKFGAPGPAG